MNNNFNNDKFLISIKRFKIYGAIMIVLFIIFIFVIIHNIKLANKIEISKIEETSRNAEIREKLARIEMDKANNELAITSGRVIELSKQLKKQNEILSRMEFNYNKSLQELKKIKNEKDYIPTDISVNEQYDFISKYKYSEYK